MKKTLSLLLIAGVCRFAQAQTEPNLPQMGSSANFNSVIEVDNTAMTANQACGLITMTHREDNSKVPTCGSGAFEAAFSTNGGTTWDTNTYISCNEPTRYPNGVIFNPAGNTNPANCYVAMAGPYLNGALSQWSGVAYGSITTGGNNANEVFFANGSPSVQTQNNGELAFMNSSDDSTVHVIGEGWDSSGQTWLGAVLTTGKFNPVTNAFEWTQQVFRPHLVPSYAGFSPTDPYDSLAFVVGSPGTAWSQDGKTGYIVIFGNLDSVGYNYASAQPIVYKTTNSGATWTMLPPYNFSNLPNLAQYLYPSADQGIPTPEWYVFGSSGANEGGQNGYSLTVDINGNLHILGDIFSSYYSDPSNAYRISYYTLSNVNIFDVYTTTNTGGWQARFIDSMRTRPCAVVQNSVWTDDANGYISFASRIRASRSTDGSLVFCTWEDDTTGAVQDSLVNPDVFSQGYDVTTGNTTPVHKFTNTGNNYFLSVSNIALQSGTCPVTYTIPSSIVYPQTTPSDGATPVNYFYLNSVAFTNNQFQQGAPVVNNNVHCNEGSDGSATAPTPTGGASPYTYQWNSGATSANATNNNLSAGTYTITVTDANSCTFTSSVTITQPSGLRDSIVTSSITNISCNGATTGSATVGATGGTSPYTYSWSNGSAGATLTANNGPSFSYEQAVQNWTVPAGVTQVTIGVIGAAGGGSGGNGVFFAGACTVIPGHNLSIVVGGQGGTSEEDDANGGGGGSFVYDSNTITLLAVAGGGGGSGWSGNAGGAGGTDLSGNATTNGVGGNASGGVNGNGGAAGSAFFANGPGGGAGWLSNGGNGTTAGSNEDYPTYGGDDQANGFLGGAAETTGGFDVNYGGYGGGGGGGYDAGGGGGGYNGGGGGNDENSAGGGGGGSYLSGALLGTAVANNSGNGFVFISYSTGVGAGTYSVTVTDNNGCSNTLSVTISQPTALRDSIVIASTVNVTCNGGNNGSATVGVQYGISPYTYTWIPNVSSTATATGLSAGTYSVVIQDACGADSTLSIIITQAAPISTTTNYAVATCNNPNGSASVTVTSGGVTPFTYSWNDPSSQTTDTASLLHNGNYTVTVTDNTGCSVTANANVLSTGGNVSAFETAGVLCNGGDNGSAGTTVSGGATPYTYQWLNGTGALTDTAAGLSAGTYTVTVSDNNGCNSSASAIITQPAVLTDSIASTVNIFCGGTSTGGATVGVSGGTPPYTYSWSSAGGSGATVATGSGGSQTFSFDSAVQNWTVPAGITQVTISISGAMGGGGLGYGGNGASFAGVCTVVPGHQLSVAVGGLGGTSEVGDGNGGGGGSFVYDSNTTTLLAAAAGGGGADIFGDAGGPGGIDLTSNAATNGVAGNASGGVNGNGGQAGAPYFANGAGGGAGWLSNGGNGNVAGIFSNFPTFGGNDRANGFFGGGAETTSNSDINYGGYGGGGGGAADAGGAGGGYNGGGGGNDDNGASPGGGGGGGSYLNGTPVGTPVANNTGYGSVTISYPPAGVAAGTYSVTVTDANGCTATASATISQAPALRDSIVTASTVNEACHGDTSGSAIVGVTGGLSPYTYSWSNGGGTNATINSFNISGSQTFSYEGGVQNWMVPAGITQVTITISGAQGGNFSLFPASGGGGLGASFSGICTVTPGHNLSVVVGQAGGGLEGGTGGGGGSLVYDSNTVSLFAAAGGGGGMAYDGNYGGAGGIDLAGNSTTAGQGGYGNASGGSSGNGGGGGSGGITGGSAGGGGWFSNGGNGQDGDYGIAYGGGDQANEFYGGEGGGGSGSGGYGGGGGGNAPGGGGGDEGSNFDGNGGGGGGSYLNGTLIGSAVANETGNGYVTISYSNHVSTGLVPGTYSVTITDANGCTDTTSVTITQPSAIRDSISSVTGAICSGESTLSETIGTVGGASPYTYSWNPNISSTATATGMSAGTYSVTVSDMNGCQGTIALTVVPPATLTVKITSKTGASCYGSSTGSATVGITGTHTFSYTPSIQNWVVPSGVTQVTVTLSGAVGGGNDGGDGASFTGIYTVSPEHVLGVVTGGQGGTSEDNDGNGGGGGSFIYDATSNNLLAAAAGGGGSGYSGSAGAAGGTDLSGNTTTNGPGGNGAGGIGGNGGSAGSPYYSNGAGGGAGWLSNGGNGSIGGSDNNYPTYGGTDQANGFLGGAAETTGGFDVNYGGFGGGGGGAWDAGGAGGGYNGGGGGNDSADAGGGGGGSYLNATYGILSGAVTATNTGNGSVVIIYNTGASPYTYSWSGGSGNDSTASGLSAGTYTVTVTDNCGSSATASVTITQPRVYAAKAFVGGNISCNGGSNGIAKVSVSGGKSPYTYSWSPVNSSTYIADGLSMGTYTVTVSDSNGCNATSAISLTQPALLRDSMIIAYPQCNGETAGATVGITGGTAPYYYNWSPNISTTASATGLTVRSYVVQVKDHNGCSNNLYFSITQPVLLRDSIVPGSINASCNGSGTGSATVGVKYGNPPYTYAWSGNGGNSSTATGLSAGVYTVTVSDGASCSATTTVTISHPTALSATAYMGAGISCTGGSNGQAKVTANGGSAPYIYSWSPVSSSTYIANGLSAGTYTVSVMDNCGSSVSSSAIVTQPALLRDSAILTYPVCNGGTGTATIGVKGGTGTYSFVWTPNVSTVASATGLTVRSYVVQVKDHNGCNNNLTFTVSQPVALRDSIVKSATVNLSCNGSSTGSATVGVKYGASPYTYSWSGNGGNSSTAGGLTAGVYTVTVNDGGGCTVTASVSITQPGALTPNAYAGVNITCNGSSTGQAKVSVSGGSTPYTYSWSPGGAISSTVGGLSAGTYTVTVMDKCSASANSSVVLTQPALLRDSVANIYQPACTKGTTGEATIGVKGGTTPYKYAWSPNVSSTDSASGLTVRNYVVQVKDNNGCSNNLTIDVTCSNGPSATYQPENTTCCPVTDNINLYPNPNTGQFTISGLQQGMILEMYDYTGKMISTMTTTNESMQLNIFSQANGVYLIRILDKNGNLAGEKKVIKTQ